MKLYYAETLAPRKVCALVKHLKVPVEFVHVDLGKGEHKQPAYLAINPNGLVPTLVDGGRALWEADAILCLLARRAGSDLWPQDDRQIEAMRWLSWNAHHFYRHAGMLYFQNLVKPSLKLGEPDAAAVAQAAHGFRTFAAVLNDHLKGRTWLVGDGLTVADFSMAVPLPYADSAHMPVDEFPEIRRWHDRLNALEAWRDPFPARQMNAA